MVSIPFFSNSLINGIWCLSTTARSGDNINKFMPSQTVENEPKLEYLYSTISGAINKSHCFNTPGKLFSVTREGLTSANPGLNKQIVLSICMEEYRLRHGWTV